VSAAEALLRGLVVGVAIAAPVGPIGLLCIRRTLADGPAAGIASGLGAATADGLYGLVAAFGLGIAAALLENETPLRLVGAGLLLWLAWGIWRASGTAAGAGGGVDAAPGPSSRPAPGAAALAAAWAGTFGLTMANPATILSFAGVIAALGPEGTAGGLWLVAGVFLGSAAWWVGLGLAVGRFRARITPALMRRIDAASALVLAGFAVAALAPLAAA
jgi:threonine/homoserine/homoserine lactone efflux protein